MAKRNRRGISHAARERCQIVGRESQQEIVLAAEITVERGGRKAGSSGDEKVFNHHNNLT